MTRPPGSVNFTAFDKQIDQDLAAGALVGDQFADAARRRPIDLDSAGFGLEPKHVAAIGDQRRDVERLGQDAELARRDLRRVEDEIDHREKVFGGGVDDLGVFALLGGLARRQFGIAEHFRESEDRVERRAQFVADIGEQPILPGIGEFGLGASRLEPLLGGLGVGDVAHDRHRGGAVAVPAPFASGLNR